jgi:RimJ/RimL family protein N-acetyltransferase
MFETERLRLRKFNEEDAEFIFELLNMPGWLKFIGDRNIRTVNDAKEYIVHKFVQSYNTLGFGPYLVELKNTTNAIGMCSLVKRDALEHADIGFAFLERYTRQGFAYEATRATMNFARKQFNMHAICAITETQNTASINLIKKLGLVFEKTVILPDETEELLLFSNAVPKHGANTQTIRQ